jgi:Ca-activated chloride channel family protein
MAIDRFSRRKFGGMLAGAAAATETLAIPRLASADGVIVIEPPECQTGACPGPIRIGDQLTVKYHRVDVQVANQVAITTIDQAFFNHNDWVAEGTYIFPIPEGASVSRFTMIVDGQEIESQILTAEEAAAIYDQIVRSMRDPALLQYVGQGAIQASVFPIPPGETREVKISYEEVLTAEGGLIRYVYPLNTEQFSAQPLEQVSVRVDVTSADSVRAIYSPSHSVAVTQDSETHFLAGWEASNLLPTDDFELIYTVAQEEIGSNLLSYVDPVTNEGYFMLLAAPGIETGQAIVAKDVVIVLDTSGSMEGEKIVQAKQAVAYVLNHLNPDDRFGVIEFSTGVRFYDQQLRAAAEAPAAASWVETLPATGGTDINRALLEAMAMTGSERPTYVVFLTDGIPTEGETDSSMILANVDTASPENVRVFSFGVGDDVDTFLLDSLVQQENGISSYVRPGERIDEEVSLFYAKVGSPVLTDLGLEFSGAQVQDLYPDPLSDLYAGSQLVLVGSYTKGGPTTVTLSGSVNGAAQSYIYEGQALTTVAGGPNDFLPRLWATRKIGYLLTQIRLHGENQELIQAVIDLSVRFGIVTPYTSYLITEDDILTQQGRDRVADEEAAAAPAEVSGGEAVDKADAQSNLSSSNQAAPTVVAGDYDGGNAIKVVGSRTYVQQNGVWIDTAFDPSTMSTMTKIVFLSDEYFAFLAAHPELAGALALGDAVIVASGGQFYEIVPAAP